MFEHLCASYRIVSYGVVGVEQRAVGVGDERVHDGHEVLAAREMQRALLLLQHISTPAVPQHNSTLLNQFDSIEQWRKQWPEGGRREARLTRSRFSSGASARRSISAMVAWSRSIAYSSAVQPTCERDSTRTLHYKEYICKAIARRRTCDTWFSEAPACSSSFTQSMAPRAAAYMSAVWPSCTRATRADQSRAVFGHTTVTTDCPPAPSRVEPSESERCTARHGTAL